MPKKLPTSAKNFIALGKTSGRAVFIGTGPGREAMVVENRILDKG